MTTRRNFLKAAAPRPEIVSAVRLLERAHAKGRRTLPSPSRQGRSRPSTCTRTATSARPARCSR